MSNAEESDPRRHERGGVGPGAVLSAEGGVIRRCVTTGFTRMHEKGGQSNEADLVCGVGAVLELRLRVGAGNLREQSGEQGRPTACRFRQSQLFEEMQAGHLSN